MEEEVILRGHGVPPKTKRNVQISPLLVRGLPSSFLTCSLFQIMVSVHHIRYYQCTLNTIRGSGEGMRGGTLDQPPHLNSSMTGYGGSRTGRGSSGKTPGRLPPPSTDTSQFSRPENWTLFAGRTENELVAMRHGFVSVRRR